MRPDGYPEGDGTRLERCGNRSFRCTALSYWSPSFNHFGAYLSPRAVSCRMCYTVAMTKQLEKAFQRVSELPEAAQETIAGDLLEHVESMEHLVAQLQQGISSLDDGHGEAADIDELIRVARAQHGEH